MAGFAHDSIIFQLILFALNFISALDAVDRGDFQPFTDNRNSTVALFRILLPAVAKIASSPSGAAQFNLEGLLPVSSFTLSTIKKIIYMTTSTYKKEKGAQGSRRSFENHLIAGPVGGKQFSAGCFSDEVQGRRFIIKGLILLAVILAAGWGLVIVGKLPEWAYKLLLLGYGWALWTVCEYAYHRFVLHGRFQTSKWLMVKRDDQLPGMFSRFLAIAAAAVSMWLAVTEKPAFTTFAGFVIGMAIACYYRIFLQWDGMRRIVPELYRNRLYHTTGGTDKAFGWSTVIWDKYFDTYVPAGIVHARQPGKPLDSVMPVVHS